MMLGSSSIASKTAVVIHTSLSLDYSGYSLWGLHIYGFSKWLLKSLTHAHTYSNSACERDHMCTSYALYAYLYCVYALVGGPISIRDPYICVVHESVTTNRTLSSIGLLSV